MWPADSDGTAHSARPAACCQDQATRKLLTFENTACTLDARLCDSAPRTEGQMDQRECHVKDRELAHPASCQRFAPIGTCLHATQVWLREDIRLRPASTCLHACTHGFTSIIACMLACTQHHSMARTANPAPCACVHIVRHDSSTLAKSGYNFCVA